MPMINRFYTTALLLILTCQTLMADKGGKVTPPPAWKTIEYRDADAAQKKEFMAFAEALNATLQKKKAEGLEELIDTNAMVDYLVDMRIMNNLDDQKRNHLKFALSMGFLQMFSQFASFYTCDSMRIVKAQVDKSGALATLTIRKKADGVFSLESWWLKKSGGKWRLYDFSSDECQVQVLVLFGALMSGQYSKEVQEWTKHMPEFLKAMQLLQQERFEECRKGLEDLAKVNMPEFVESIRLLLLAILYYADEDSDKALAHAEKALAVKADLFAAYDLIAEIQLEREKPDLVLRTAEKYFKVLGKEPSMSLSAVKAYRMKKEDAKAEALCIEALKVEPSAHELVLELVKVVPEKRFEVLKPYLKPLLTPRKKKEAKDVEDLFDNDDRYQEVLEAFFETENLAAMKYLKSSAKDLKLDSEDLETLEVVINSIEFSRDGGFAEIIKKAGKNYRKLGMEFAKLLQSEEEWSWALVVERDADLLIQLTKQIVKEMDSKEFERQFGVLTSIGWMASTAQTAKVVDKIDSQLVPELVVAYGKLVKLDPGSMSRLGLLKDLLSLQVKEAHGLMLEAMKENKLKHDLQWKYVIEEAAASFPHEWAKLVDKIPNDRLLMEYLCLANEYFGDGLFDDHPFDTPKGRQILIRFLGMDDEYYVYGCDAIETFDKQSVTAMLPSLRKINAIPHTRLKVASWGAKHGIPDDLGYLKKACLDYHLSMAARRHLFFLDRRNDIPKTAIEAKFQMKAEAAGMFEQHTLTKFEMVDSRTIFWPPMEKKLTVALYRYAALRHGGKKTTGLVMGGAGGALITRNPTDKLNVADAYALYCSFEAVKKTERKTATKGLTNWSNKFDELFADEGLDGLEDPDEDDAPYSYTPLVEDGSDSGLKYSVEDGHKLLKAKNPTWPK